jgi:hypothetical protein
MKNRKNRSKVQQTQECENCDFLYEIIEHTKLELDEMRLWLSVWSNHLALGIPGFDGYTARYPEWPVTVSRIYHWPREFKRGGVTIADAQVVQFLDHGAENEILVFRRYPEGYDWNVLNPEAYAQLLSEFGFSESSFGMREWTKLLELERSRLDIIRGTNSAKISR